MSWNVHGEPLPLAEAQLREVVAVKPHVIALQEVVAGSLPYWLDGLRGEGFSVVCPPPEMLKIPGPYLERKQRRMRRRNLNLVAARYPITPLRGLAFPDPVEAFPEKYVAARIAAQGNVIDIHNAHLPPGASTEMIKVEAFEAIRRRIDEPTPAARVLCGDFNAPWCENDHGFKTAAHRHAPEVRERWDKAERMILEHPELSDVYRAQRKAGTPFAASHYTGRTRRRYDHVYVSPEFTISRCKCKYLDSLRDDGLSDHAPLLATLLLA